MINTTPSSQAVERPATAKAVAWYRHWFSGALAFGLVHGLLVGSMMTTHTLATGQVFGARAIAVLIIFTLGGLLGGLAAWWLARWLFGGRSWPVRMALFALLLTLSTVGAIAFMHFLQLSLTDNPLADQPSIRIWILRNFFTAIGSLLFFLIIGLRLLLPAGALVLLASTALFVWQTATR